MIEIIFRSSVIAAALLLSANSAFAHAEVVTSTPAADSTVTTSPTEIDITFSEGISLKFSGAKLADSMKMDISTGSPVLAKGGDTTLVIPVTKPLSAGEYVVAWHNLSKDGHKSKGSFKFTVKN